MATIKKRDIINNIRAKKTYGKLSGIKDIISLIPAEADGTVIDLNEALSATGNYN